LFVSFADFVRDSLRLIQLKIPETKETKEKARKAGYDQGKREHQIWYFCAACGKRIDMSPNGNDHKAMIGYMREYGWGHRECHRH